MNSLANKFDAYQNRKGSDYGAVFDQCLDDTLRGRVVSAMQSARSGIKSLDDQALRDLATYISFLENEYLTMIVKDESKTNLESAHRLNQQAGLDVMALKNKYLVADTTE